MMAAYFLDFESLHFEYVVASLYFLRMHVGRKEQSGGSVTAAEHVQSKISR